MEKTGFGVSVEGDPHHWIVRIPKDRKANVVVLEHYGRNGWSSGDFDAIQRASIPRASWDAVAAPLAAYLNGRLKEKGFKGSKFKSGDNQVERLLGNAVCLIAWTIDDANEDQAREAFTSFMTYASFEISALYQYAKSASDMSREAYGWRKAVKFALMPSLSMPMRLL